MSSIAPLLWTRTGNDYVRDGLTGRLGSPKEFGDTIIAGAINLLEQIDASYSPDQAENLTRKLLNAIRTRDAGRFARTVRRSHANQ